MIFPSTKIIKKGEIIREGDIGPFSTKIQNVLFVDGFKHNLLSISQLCDKENRVIFEANRCSVQNTKDNRVHFVSNRC